MKQFKNNNENGASVPVIAPVSVVVIGVDDLDNSLTFYA